MKENIKAQVTNRIKFILGDKATEDNINYIAEPYFGLIDKYAGLVDESRVEIDSLNQVLESKNMDIATLSSENEKYMMLAGMGSVSKRNWDQFEDLLGSERIVNRKFVSMVAEQSKKKLIKAGRTDTYRAYLASNSNFATGEGMSPFFPYRNKKGKY